MSVRTQSTRRYLIFAALLCCEAVVARGQVDLSSWPQVRVGLLALDRHGDPMAIDKTNLLLLEDGVPRLVEAVEPANAPQSVCLLTDSSGSMYERKASLRAAAERIIQDLPPEDEICVADFSFKVFIDQKLTTDHKLLQRALGLIQTKGGTAMYDAVAATATYMMTSSQYKSRAIILLDDIDDNASNIDEAQLRRNMIAGGTPVVHVVRIPSPDPSDPYGHEGRKEEKTALSLAGTGGGLVYLPRDARDLEVSIDSLCRAMTSRYELLYLAGDPSANGQERTLRLTLDKQRQKAKAVARAPEGYYAPAR